MSLTHKILSNTFWQVAGKMVTAILGVISIKIITGYLNTELYGQYVNMFDYISFFAIAADFGLYTIGVREMAKKEKPLDFILGNILSLRISLLAITLTIGALSTNLIPKYSDTIITQGIWLVAVITALTMLSGTLTSVLQYKLKMLAANISFIISKTVTVGYIALTAFYLFPNNPEAGLTHLLYGGIIGGLVTTALTTWLVAKYTKIRFSLNRQYVKYLVKESAPYGISLVLSTIYFRIDAIILTFIKGYTEAAIYAVPLKLMEILSVIPVFFMNSLLPTLTEYLKENVQKAQSIVNNAFRLLYTLALPTLVGGFLIAFPLTFVISSPQFLTGYHCTDDMRIVTQVATDATALCENTTHNSDFAYNEPTSDLFVYQNGSDIAFKYIIFAVFFSFLNTLFSFSLVALGDQKKLLWINLVGVTFNIGTNLLLIPIYGFQGAAITTILSEMIILIGTYLAYHKKQTFKPEWRKLAITTIAAAIMGIIIFMLLPLTYSKLQNWNIVFLIPLGGLIYGAILYLTKTITWQDLKTLLSP